MVKTNSLVSGSIQALSKSLVSQLTRRAPPNIELRCVKNCVSSCQVFGCPVGHLVVARGYQLTRSDQGVLNLIEMLSVQAFICCFSVSLSGAFQTLFNPSYSSLDLGSLSGIRGGKGEFSLHLTKFSRASKNAFSVNPFCFSDS